VGAAQSLLGWPFYFFSHFK
jgi:hypothetical protein